MATLTDVPDTLRPTADAVPTAPGGRRPPDTAQILRWIVLFLGGVLMVMPIAYMISTSLKWPHEVYNVNLIPEDPTIENYTYVL